MSSIIQPDFNELIDLKSRLKKLHHTNKLGSSDSGNYLSAFRGHGMEFDDVRQYDFGDDLRSIDWKLTAKLGVPHIKLFKENRQLNIILSIDMNHTMRFGTRGVFKSVQAARSAAFLAWCANHNNDHVGAYLFGNSLKQNKFLPTKSSKTSLLQMIRILSDQNLPGDINPYTMLNQSVKFVHKVAPIGGIIFIISDFIAIDQEFCDAIYTLINKCKVILVSINDPSDMAIPDIGNIYFTNLNKCTDDTLNTQKEIHINTNCKTSSYLYKQKWLENRNVLKKLQKNTKIKLINIMTNQDAIDLLSCSIY